MEGKEPAWLIALPDGGDFLLKSRQFTQEQEAPEADQPSKSPYKKRAPMPFPHIGVRPGGTCRLQHCHCCLHSTMRKSDKVQGSLTPCEERRPACCFQDSQMQSLEGTLSLSLWVFLPKAREEDNRIPIPISEELWPIKQRKEGL